MLVAIHVGQFAFAGIVAVAIVGIALAVASRRVGEREGISEARVTTLIKAQSVVEPVITEELLDGDRTAIARLRVVVARDVVDSSLVRVKLWSQDGRILFSDEPALIGQRFDLGSDELDALATGRIVAEVSDLGGPENVFEREIGSKLLEVYLPVHTPQGEPLLFEAYYRYNSVQASGTRLWKSFAPISLGALVMLELVQIPLAWSLARRLRSRLQERESLMQRALDASEVERRQIASDLHDGVVQDLAGVAYALSARARANTTGEHGSDPEAEQIAETVRESIRALRSLVIDLYPPNLREEGLASALHDLTERSGDKGLPAELDTSGLLDPLPDAVAGLLYRSAQEGLRNAVQHSNATHVRVRVLTDQRLAILEVIDDGSGFDESILSEREAAGHVGLKALRGLVVDGGGSLRIRSNREQGGTTMTVEIPLP